MESLTGNAMGQSGGSTRSLTSCISNASWSQWKAARTVRSVSIPRNSGLEMSSSESCRGCNSELKSLQRLLKMSAYLQGDFRRRSTCMLTHEVVLKNSSNFKQSRSLRISFYALSSMTRRMAPISRLKNLRAATRPPTFDSCMPRVCVVSAGPQPPPSPLLGNLCAGFGTFLTVLDLNVRLSQQIAKEARVHADAHDRRWERAHARGVRVPGHRHRLEARESEA